MSDYKDVENIAAMMNGQPQPHPAQEHHTPWGPMLGAAAIGYFMAPRQQQPHPPATARHRQESTGLMATISRRWHKRRARRMGE